MRWGLWGLEWRLQVFVVEFVEDGGRIEASLAWHFIVVAVGAIFGVEVFDA